MGGGCVKRIIDGRIIRTKTNEQICNKTRVGRNEEQIQFILNNSTTKLQGKKKTTQRSHRRDAKNKKRR